MDIQPASIDQIREAEDGEWAIISAEAGTVAGDLARIDPELKVRLATRQGIFVVYTERFDADGKRHTEYVLTQQASRNRFGVWEGLDQRVVRRIEEIDPQGRSGYNYAQELERVAHARKEANRKKFQEKIAASGEEAVHALRRDLGVKSRAFIK